MVNSHMPLVDTYIRRRSPHRVVQIKETEQSSPESIYIELIIISIVIVYHHSLNEPNSMSFYIFYIANLVRLRPITQCDEPSRTRCLTQIELLLFVIT